MNFILAVVLLASASRAADRKPETVKVFPRTAFALPQLEGVKMDWVLPPSQAQLRGRAKSAKLRFDVSPDGRPWFVDGRDRILMSPTEELLVRTPGVFDDAVFLDGGAHLVCADHYLAVPHSEEKDRKLENGVLQIQLRAVLKLEHGDCRLFSGGANLLYIVLHNEKTGQDEVSTLRSGGGEKPRAEKILTTRERITALAGDGDKTYFTLGKAIMELSRGEQKAKPFYTPEEPATSLAYSPDAGLFYATKSHAGFAGRDFQMNFLASPNPQIALRGDEVYVRLSGTLAVLKISGAGRFKTLRWPDKATKASTPENKAE